MRDDETVKALIATGYKDLNERQYFGEVAMEPRLSRHMLNGVVSLSIC